MAYVIKSWRAQDRPDAEGNFVTITGRKEGIISWVLAFFKIDPTISIKVSAKRIEFSEVSFSGSSRRIIPLTGVCSTLDGFHKPWKEALGLLLFLGWLLGILGGAVLGAVSSIMTGVGALVGLLISVAIAVAYYFLNRTLTLGFVENSGAVSVIQFKRSVVENQDIDEAQAGYVCKVIQALLAQP